MNGTPTIGTPARNDSSSDCKPHWVMKALMFGCAKTQPIKFMTIIIGTRT